MVHPVNLSELQHVKNLVRLTVLSTALCAAGLSAHATASTSGVVVGAAGYFQNALVCLDTNANGRCDAGETSAVTDANGAFTLPGTGAVIAQIGTNAFLINASTGTATPVSRALKFRAPAQYGSVVSAVTTEIQALMDSNGGDLAGALASLSARLGVSSAQLLENPLQESDTGVKAILVRENAQLLNRIGEATAEAGQSGNVVKSLRNRLALDQITNVIVIYAENHSFDNLYGTFPGANGLKTAQAQAIKQVDRDGVTVLAKLPPSWNGLTASGQLPAVTQAQTVNVWPNAPFQIDAPTSQYGYAVLGDSIVTRDMYHRFFENGMQINGGKNNMFAAWADSGGTVMGYYDGSTSKLWSLAKQYTLADNFFQAAYGGSFLNHQYLACACVPTVPAATVSANKMTINVLGAALNGVPQLQSNTSQAASALNSATSFKTGNIAPLDYFGAGDGYRAVNTMQPAFQPSGNKPASNTGNAALYATPTAANTLPAQTQTNIGDLLNAKGLGWTWYSGGWSAASANPYPYSAGAFGTSTTIYNASSAGTSDAAHSDFQAHHQPFNYFANLDPASHASDRAAHLKDRSDLMFQAQTGTLPAVAFYKPVGQLNQHPGYANVSDGDSEIANVVAALQASPQWPHMLILITYDEFGGQFDHVAPPKGDLAGPGTRIPAIVISPFAKKGFVDHTQYDTASFLRFVTNRYSLPVLTGLQLRDNSLVSNGGKVMGDLTNVLSF